MSGFTSSERSARARVQSILLAVGIGVWAPWVRAASELCWLIQPGATGLRCLAVDAAQSPPANADELEAPSPVFNFAWSPDGSLMAAVCRRESADRRDIWLLDSATRKWRRLIEDRILSTHPWSPRGRWLLVRRPSSAAGGDVQLIDPSDGTAHGVFQALGTWAFSPDGKAVATTVAQDVARPFRWGNGMSTSVMLYDVGSQQRHTIVRGDEKNVFEFIDWLDASRLVYLKRHFARIGTKAVFVAQRYFLVDLNTGAAEPLAHYVPAAQREPDLLRLPSEFRAPEAIAATRPVGRSPDGSAFAFLRDDRLWVAPLDGSWSPVELGPAVLAGWRKGALSPGDSPAHSSSVSHANRHFGTVRETRSGLTVRVPEGWRVSRSEPGLTLLSRGEGTPSVMNIRLSAEQLPDDATLGDAVVRMRAAFVRQMRAVQLTSPRPVSLPDCSSPAKSLEFRGLMDHRRVRGRLIIIWHPPWAVALTSTRPDEGADPQGTLEADNIITSASFTAPPG